MDGYTREQKQELSLLFAKTLYDMVITEESPEAISVLVKRTLIEMKKFPWFLYDGNEYGLLRHLEEKEVYGIFFFFPDKRASLYLRAVYSKKFSDWVKQTRPSLRSFLAAYPRSEAKKPTEDLMKGNVSSVGKLRINVDYRY